MIKRAGSQRRDLGKRDEENPYKHVSLPAEVKFNRGAHAYDVRIQTIVEYVKSIRRHYSTIK